MAGHRGDRKGSAEKERERDGSVEADRAGYRRATSVVLERMRRSRKLSRDEAAELRDIAPRTVRSQEDGDAVCDVADFIIAAELYGEDPVVAFKRVVAWKKAAGS